MFKVLQGAHMGATAIINKSVSLYNTLNKCKLFSNPKMKCGAVLVFYLYTYVLVLYVQTVKKGIKVCSVCKGYKCIKYSSIYLVWVLLK